MKLGVVIVTYNRIELLKECLKACLEQTEKFEKIIIVNNASNDGTKEYLETIKENNLEIANLDNNTGGAGGFYEGLKIIQKFDMDYVLLIDDDAIIDKDYNKYILNYINKDDKNIVGYSGTVKTNSKIQLDHRKHLEKGFKTKDSKIEEYSNEYFDYELSSFCGLYVPMEIVKKIGLPEKEFFIWYDDTEYSLRLIKYGKIRNINSAILNHKTKESKTTGYSWKSYYGLRNSLVIVKKYFSKWEFSKKVINMKFMIIASKIMRLIKNDIYYKEVGQIYKDALNDGKNEKLGKNEKYTYKYKIAKKEK